MRMAVEESDWKMNPIWYLMADISQAIWPVVAPVYV